MHKLSFALLALLPAYALAANSPVFDSANKMVPGVKWQAKSVQTGDFSCKGKVESAILGTQKTEVVVAIFLDGVNKAPKVLRFASTERDPKTTVLSIEDQNFNPKAMKEEMGEIPQGMLPSKTCKALHVEDGKIDAIHIYWNHVSKAFADWGL